MHLSFRFAAIFAVLLLACSSLSPAQTASDSLTSVMPDALAKDTIITVAGNGSYGYCGDGSRATVACLRRPIHVSLDQSGNFYIADHDNDIIRMVNLSSGDISTVAGTPASGGSSGDGGLATAAQLNGPSGVAFDCAGNMYIADTNNNEIREVLIANKSTPTYGNIITFAGTGTAGYNGDGGAAVKAELNSPQGVAFDKSCSNLYISDTGNNVIRTVNMKSLLINTFAGTGVAGLAGDGGPAIDAELNTPLTVFVDPKQNVYIPDYGNSAVRKIDGATQNISTIAGTGQYGYSYPGDNTPATMVNLRYPYGVVVDAAGDVFFSDDGIDVIFEVMASTGDIKVVAGTPYSAGFSGDDGPATAAQLYTPLGIAADSSGDLYIADITNERVRKVIGLINVNPPAATKTSLTESEATISAGEPVTFTAMVTPASATGDVAFTVDGKPAATVTLSGGKAVYTTSTLGAGKHVVVASYEGTATYAGSTSGSVSVTVTESPALEPVFSPSAGTYTKSISVVLTGATKGATIYYRISPSTTWIKYTVAIAVDHSETIEAYATAPNYENSPVVSAPYVIDAGVTATPVISPGHGGPYGTGQPVTVTDETKGALIYCTSNGVIPTTKSTKYTGMLLVITSEVLQCVAQAPGYEVSTPASVAFTIVDTPAVLTDPATAISATGATLNALVSTFGGAATYSFEYGTTSTALSSTTKQGSIAATSTRVSISAKLTGLKAKTTYSFRAVVTTVGGSSMSAIGSFTTD